MRNGGMIVASAGQNDETPPPILAPFPEAAAAGSWLALLAATTVGDAAGTIEAKVRARGLQQGSYRLVVQSYDASHGRVPGPEERPVGSTQRTVTADELLEGVQVSLLELRKNSDTHVERPTVVAWIDAAGAGSDFDGREARPQAGSLVGVTRRPMKDDIVQISLTRSLES